MGEGAAAAAGPIGIAVATAIAVKVAVDQAVKEAIGEVGKVISSVASPSSDPAKPIAELGEAASKTGEKLPVLGTAAIVAGESLKALASVMQALDKTAERYGQYSPQIAQAQAIAEVRQTIGDLRRAQTIAPEMARYIQAQSDLQQKFEDTKIRLLTKILPVITRILEIIEGAMAAGESVASVIAAPLNLIADAMSQILGIHRDARMPEIEDPTEQLLRMNFDWAGTGRPDDPGWVPRR